MRVQLTGINLDNKSGHQKGGNGVGDTRGLARKVSLVGEQCFWGDFFSSEERWRIISLQLPAPRGCWERPGLLGMPWGGKTQLNARGTCACCLACCCTHLHHAACTCFVPPHCHRTEQPPRPRFCKLQYYENEENQTKLGVCLPGFSPVGGLPGQTHGVLRNAQTGNNFRLKKKKKKKGG